MLLEVERLLDVAAFMGELPKYLLLENVKNLVSKRFKPDFDKWLQKLETLGYTNYWQVLNAKDYGIPQNRERVFCVSILGYEYFEFPKKQELKLKLKDMLEEEVEEKYYLSNEMIKNITQVNKDEYNLNYYNYDEMNRVYTDQSCCPALRTMTGGNRQPKILIKNATKQGYLEAIEGDSINLAYPTSNTRRGRVGNQVSQTLQTSDNMGVVVNKRIEH